MTPSVAAGLLRFARMPGSPVWEHSFTASSESLFSPVHPSWGLSVMLVISSQFGGVFHRGGAVTMVPAVHVGVNSLSQLFQGWGAWKVVRNEGMVQSGGRWETGLGCTAVPVCVARPAGSSGLPDVSSG